jgi:hypothetical protein
MGRNLCALFTTPSSFSANANNLLGVYDITNVQSTSTFNDVKYSPSNVAIATKWHVVQAQGFQPIWFVSLALKLMSF